MGSYKGRTEGLKGYDRGEGRARILFGLRPFHLFGDANLGGPSPAHNFNTFRLVSGRVFHLCLYQFYYGTTRTAVSINRSSRQSWNVRFLYAVCCCVCCGGFRWKFDRVFLFIFHVYVCVVNNLALSVEFNNACRCINL